MAENFGSDNQVQVVVFKLGQEEYGINILQVQEIKQMTEITRIPQVPDYITGVINLRRSVLPVMDLKRRLGLAPQPITDDTRIIIVKIDDTAIGMIVDAVTEVLTINRENIEPPQAGICETSTNYLSGVGKLNDRLLILLNVANIISIGQ